MMHMMDGACGPLMIVVMGLSWLLGLGLVASLIVLVWTAIGRLRRTPVRSQLIGSEGDEGFAPEDAERIRLIQFLERREIGLETIARGERDEATLSSVVQFLFPHGLGPTYSLDQAVDIVGLDAEVARRLRDA